MSELHAAVISARKQSAPTRTQDERRWLFVDGATTLGGHEVMLLRWLEELSEQRAVTCFLLARAGSQLAREAERHASVLELRQREAGIVQALAGAMKDVAAFVRAVGTSKPNLCVVAEGCLLAQPLFVLLARLLRVRVLVYVPLVQTSVSMGFGKGGLRDALVRGGYAQLPHGWITITQEQAEHFRAWARVRRPIFVLPNTVASAIEHRGLRDLRDTRAAADDTRLRVLVLGRIEAHQKGLDTLLDFLATHPQLGAQLRVSLVGSGPYEADVRARLTSDATLANWVSLEPWSAPQAAYDAHDVLLMTSRYEGVPLVMLEAMALGLPVIAPQLDGTRAFLAHADLFPRERMDVAFRLLERMSDPRARQVAAERNRAQFEATASSCAFTAAVRALTHQLDGLASASLQRRSA